jgi:predicted ATPase/DNA-binding CsgD family transcriptional regulator/tetratricopeptide (TPR) repeat protein
MDNKSSPKDLSSLNELTWREQEVLLLLAERKTNQEIASQLHLAESTVKDYVGKILAKLYVKNRRQAVEKAKELGFLNTKEKIEEKPASNLPPETTPFIGRRATLNEIKGQFENTRLLTLSGPGGIGKTRLAIKAAEEIFQEFKSGCFFVSLAPISSIEHLIQAIAEAIKFPIATHEDPQFQLLRYLRGRNLLLVMDNFEHLLDGTEIVNEILLAAPEVRILVTSRERLNLQTEINITIGGMVIPGKIEPETLLQYDSIDLFIQSANKVRPRYQPSAEELRQIAHICQIVDGIPLAIELAAAWLQILSLDEIIRELEKGLDILSTEMRDAPERHRSIRTVFDQSWSLLEEDEQAVFTYLAVFRGGFTREAAQQVAGVSLQKLLGLVDKSLLSYDPDSGRLEIHELLRQYAQEQLEKKTENYLTALEDHAAFYAEFMQQGWERLRSKEQLQALGELEADIENVRSAWRYYLNQKNIPKLWKFVHGIWYLYWIRWWNHAGMEFFAHTAEVLKGEVDEEAQVLRALAQAYQSYFMSWLGLADQGYEIAKKSAETLQELNHPGALVFAHNSFCINAYFLAKYAEEFEALRQMVEIAAGLEDKWLTAFMLFGLGLGSIIKGEYSKAKEHAEEQLELYEEYGDEIGTSTPLIVLGHVALGQGEYEEARGHYLRCLNIAQKFNFYYSMQTATKYLGKVSISLDKLVDAEKYLSQSLRITHEIGFIRDIVNLVYEFSRLYYARGNPERATQLLTLVIDHPASKTYRMLEGHIIDSALDLYKELESGIPPDDFQQNLQIGREMDLDQVVSDLLSSGYKGKSG